MLAESPAWWALVLAVKRRQEAEAALLAGNVNFAATAATVSKEGGRVWRKLADQLEKLARE